MSNLLYLALNGAGLAAGLLIAVFWLQKHGTAALTIQPAVAFSVYFSLIHFFMPFYKYASGNYRYSYEYAPITMVYNAMISLTVFFLLNLLLRNPGRYYDSERYREIQPGATLAFLTGLGVTLAGLFAMMMVDRQIGMIGYDAFRSDRIMVSAQIGLFTRIDTIVLPGLALMLAGMLNSHRRRLIGWIVLVGATIYAARYYAMMQSRNSIILMFLILTAVFFFYRSRSLRFAGRGAKTWITILLGLVGFGWFGYTTTVARYIGVDHWYAHAALDNMIFTILDGPFGNDENLLWLMEYGHPYYWGKTYIAGITNLVPRSIWPDKPWGAGPEIRNLIYPGSYILGAEGNSSITTGFLTEARMNLGLAGILLVSVVWVWLMRRLVRALLRSKTVYGQAILIFTLCLANTAFIYSEFLGFFGRIIMCLAFVTFIKSLIEVIFRMGLGR